MHPLLKKTITHFGFSLLENDVIEVEVAEVFFSLQRIFALSLYQVRSIPPERFEFPKTVNLAVFQMFFAGRGQSPLRAWSLNCTVTA